MPRSANVDCTRQVLEYLFTNGPTTRAELGNILGIRRNTVGDVTTELLSEGALVEVTPDRKRNVLLGLCPDRFYAVGISHAPAGAQLVLMDVTGSVVRKASVELRGIPGVERCEKIALATCELLEGSGVLASRTVGIGFGGHGISDLQRGIGAFAVGIPGWHDVPVTATFERSCGLRTWLFGYTDAMAAVPMREIAEPGWDTAICCWVGAGLGLSVFLNGTPLRGNHAVFGETAHIVVDPNGRPCECGNRGCLCTVASAGAIVARVCEGMRQGAYFPSDKQTGVTIQSVITNAKAGNKLAIHALSEAATALGHGLAVTANLFGISTMLFMGEMLEAGDLFFEPVRRTIRHDCMTPLNRDIQFMDSPIACPDPAVGAAFLAFGKHFGRTPE